MDTMNSDLFDSVTVIVRAADERTVDTCRKLIEEQGYPHKVYITNEVPFSAAVQKAFEIGISEKRKWTLCVDADVLLRRNSIVSLVTFADSQQANAFVIQGDVQDKFFPFSREAGNHLYRTSLLAKALPLIPDEGKDIRPESYVIRTMDEKGHPKISFPDVIGLHDYEQFYLDIYRKSFVQARKHLQYTDLIIPLWKEKMDADDDYEIALSAFANGLLYREELYINKNQDIYKKRFEELGIVEKSKIENHTIGLPDVEEILKEDISAEYATLNPDRFSKSINKKLLSRFEEYGFFKSVILTAGFFLTKVGNRLKEFVLENDG